MKIFRSALISLMFLMSYCFAQPSIPKERIPNDIPEFMRAQIESLYSPNSVERGRAVIHLGNLQNVATPAIPFLMSMFEEDGATLEWKYYEPVKWSWPVNLTVLVDNSLIQIGGPAVDSLIVKLGSSDVFLRIRAARALGKVKNNRAVVPLISSLRLMEENPALQEVIESLGDLKDPLAVEPLIVSLNSSYPSVRVAAVKALAKIADPHAISPLVQVYQSDKDPSVREEAIWVLLAFGESHGMKFFDSIMRTGNSDLRWKALTSVIKTNDSALVEPLLYALADSGFHVRNKASDILGSIADQRAIDALIELLRDTSLRDHYMSLYDAERALKKITKQNFGKDFRKWQKWWKVKNKPLRNGS